MTEHIISARDFDREFIENFIRSAQSFFLKGHALFRYDDPKILATLFFEPSTRTRFSFESAMLRLGGKTLGFSDDTAISSKKGESLHDTIRTIEGYADVIVIRHPSEGAARLASHSTDLDVPIINGGDGSNQHPTQMLTDVLTIHQKHGRLDGLKIGYIGDLKYGRTVHSLVDTMSKFEVEHFFIPPDPSLQIEADHLCSATNRTCHFVNDLESVLPHLDVLYVTRLQKERFPDPMDFERIIKSYLITAKTLEKAKSDLIVMHPLPRNSEIHRSVDDHPAAWYFRQAHNGVVARKTLLYNLATHKRIPPTNG